MSFKFIKICSKWHCCEVENMCGRGLKEGMVIVGVASLLLIDNRLLVNHGTEITLYEAETSRMSCFIGPCAIFIAGYCTVLSLAMLFSSLGCLIIITRADHLFNTQPMVAVNFIFALVASCLSCYQILISLMLLWQARQDKGSIFVCSLWYVSHISLLSMYFLLFSAKFVVCCLKQHYFIAVFTAIIGILYEGAFIYFAIVVNTYLHSLNQERYL